MKRREASLRALIYDAMLAHHGVTWTSELYTAFAKSVSGAVLELGAGTGHVLKDLLRGGVDAFGLEIEPAMLARGRQRLRRSGVRDAKSRLVIGDMRDFAHSRRYSAVILPYNTMALMTDTRDLVRLLEAVGDHLNPDGEFMFDLTLAADQDWVKGYWERPRLLLDYDGYCLSVVEKGHFDAETGKHRWVQQVSFPDGQQVETVRDLQHRGPGELKALFAERCWEYVFPPVDQAGHAISASSRLFIARIRKR